MRLLYLIFGTSLLAACGAATTAPLAADAATANDLGAAVDRPIALDRPVAMDGPAEVDRPIEVDRPVAVDHPEPMDVATLAYRELPPLSPMPIRRFAEAPAPTLMAGYDYRATITTDVGAMTIDLFEDEAPVTVNSFVWLARNHFFDGIAFHRVIEGFVAQGGDPNTIDGGRSTWGRGGPGYNFGIEVTDALRFDGPGVLGMARSTSPNSNGSQFYLTLAATPNLDGMYTVFGRAVSAADLAVLNAIVRGEPPETPTRITSVAVLVGQR
jgi:cyclophilin family peptidyl-prolyl cis-trans isomerase